MMTSGPLSLNDCYGPRGLSHPDPLVRVAALHHAGRRLAGDPGLRERMLGLLSDGDPLVARYAALTLAQAEQPEGLERLLDQMASAGGPERAALGACLRGCRAFPFAALLEELLHPDHLAGAHRREGFLRDVLSLSAEGLVALARRDAEAADDLLRRLAELDGAADLPCKGDAFCDRGVVLGLPREGEPGVLCCPPRRLFLQFHEEQAVNPEHLRRGAEVVLVARRGDPAGSAARLYVLDHRPAQPLALHPGLLADGGAGGLRPGVVAAAEGVGLRMLCADGGEVQGGLPAEAAVGRLALAEPAGARRLLLLDPVVPGEFAEAVLRSHAARSGGRLGHVAGPDSGGGRKVQLEGGEELAIRLDGAREGDRVLVQMRRCPRCQGKGSLACDDCGGSGRKACVGWVTCADGPHPWLIEGCGGAGRLPCGECQGNGQARCATCQGAVRRLASDPRACFACDGKGLVRCTRCEGRGDFRCPACKGAGHLEQGCPRCRGAGEMACSPCEGFSVSSCLMVGRPS
jgi:hypothetical protein